MVFFQHPRKGLHFGEKHPTFVDSRGCRGRLELLFPGFGSSRGEDWSLMVGFLPMFLSGGDWSIANDNAQLVEEHATSSPDRVRRVRGCNDGRSCPNLLLLPDFDHPGLLLIRRLSAANRLVSLSRPVLPTYLFISGLPSHLYASVLSNGVQPACNSNRLFCSSGHDDGASHPDIGCERCNRAGDGGDGTRG